MQTVAQVIKNLMMQEPYYGIFACSLVKEFTDKIDTLAVTLDGINYKLLINKDWWYKCTPNQRYGDIKHELLHLVFYHVVDADMWIGLCKDKEMLNVAMDLEVQSYIDEIYWNEECSAEQLFRKFPNLPKRMGTKFYIKFLKDIQEYDPKKQHKGQDPYGGNAQAYQDAKNILNNGKGLDSHDSWGNNLSDGAKDLIRNQIDYQQKETAKQTIKTKGNLPAELQETLEKLLNPKPPVFNWKSYFRRLLGIAFDIYQKKTRRKESERFEDSYGLKRKKKHKLLVAIDTSGSVSQEELKDFFSEIYHIWKAGADVHILECDAKIGKEYDYNGKVPEYVSGRGGTSFLPCIKYYNEHRKDYTTMVYFTDGYGDQDECKPLNKMLWVITSEGLQDGTFPGIKICIPKQN